jgi:hypothetical protein
MGRFEEAYLYADSCLRLSAELLDYNSLNAAASLPIPKFNVEVLFSAMSANLGIMGATNALMVDELYHSYAADDLRKTIFFRANSNPANSFYFKGSYDQSSAQMFMGITTSEVYLIKSEAACRIGRTDDALTALNTLLEKRWNRNAVYPTITQRDPDILLRTVLDERRKELLFRGRRWADLKRLNLDPRFRKPLQRQLEDDTYTLPANDLKYAFRLSETLTRVAGIPQNKR